MEAPLWKLDKLKASGQQQVNRVSETFAFAGFRWPNDNPTCTHFVSAEENPEVFLILDPVYLVEGEVALVRADSSVAAKRVFEIFDTARLLFNDQPQNLAYAVRRGFDNAPKAFYVCLKGLLVEKDIFYSDFGFDVVKRTLVHFGKAVMDEYRITDKATVNTKAVRKAWKSVKDFMELVAPNNCSLHNPESRRYGDPVIASSSPTTNTPATAPALSQTSTELNTKRTFGDARPHAYSPSGSSMAPPEITMNGRGTDTAPASKRKPVNPLTNSAKPEKRVQRDSVPHTSPTTSQSRRLKGQFWIGDRPRPEARRKTAENRDLKKRTEAMEGSAEPNEAKLQKENRDLRNRINAMEESSKGKEADEAKLREENSDLKQRIEAMEGSARASTANEARLQKELLLKTIEAAGLEAANQRIAETGSFKQRLELARQAVEIRQKTAQVKDLEENEGALRRRIEELEALQKEAAQAKEMERAKGFLRKCNERLKTIQSNAGAAEDMEEVLQLLRKDIEELKAFQAMATCYEDANIAKEVKELLHEGMKNLDLFLKIRNLDFGL